MMMMMIKIFHNQIYENNIPHFFSSNIDFFVIRIKIENSSNILFQFIQTKNKFNRNVVFVILD